MKFNILSLDEKTQKSLKILSKSFDFEISEDGIVIKYIKTDSKNISAKYNNKENILEISSKQKSGFYKALSEYILTKEDFTSSYSFENLGMMIDNARNGVVNVEYLKLIIEKLAFMGHNTLYLYIEDNYELEGYEYFGHLRGKFSKKDLKELDDYAFLFDIELVPCIQTLAHINQFFYWEHIEKKYADIDDVLLVGDKEVNKLLEDIIKHFSTTLRTRRIHLGMDEAYNLGRGRYADRNGLKEKSEIMLEHLNNLLNLCNKYDLKPMIWDDMFFTAYSKLENEDDFSIPDGISLMYWDYYNSNENHYIERITQRKKISKDVKFAGGAWRWTGYTPHHSKTIKTLNASLNACVKEDISEILITSWADDGTESPVYNMMLGALISSSKRFNISDYERRCKFYLDIDFDDFLEVEKLDLVEGTDKDFTPSKYLFYEDPFMSKLVYHTNLLEEDLTNRYVVLHETFNKLKDKYKDNELFNLYFDFYSVYAKYLSIKWNLAKNIYNYYNAKNKEALKIEVEKIDKLIPLIKELSSSRKKLWLFENMRYGYEVLEQRFGGISLRLESCKEDLLEHIKNDYEITELNEIRLAIDDQFENKGLILYNRSQRIMSANKMIW